MNNAMSMYENIEYIAPEQLLQMPVGEYLLQFGDQSASERLKKLLCNKLNKNADLLRSEMLLGKPKSKPGEELLVWDLVRIPHVFIRKVRIGRDSLHFISEALERNELKLNMSDSAIDKYIEDFDVNIAKLRSVLEALCQRCITEKKHDFSRIFDRKKEIMPGFSCYVLVTKI